MTGAEALTVGYLHLIQLLSSTASGQTELQDSKKCWQDPKPETLSSRKKKKTNKNLPRKKKLPLCFQTIILQEKLQSTEVERHTEKFCFLLFGKLQVELKMQNCF